MISTGKSHSSVVASNIGPVCA